MAANKRASGTAAGIAGQVAAEAGAGTKPCDLHAAPTAEGLAEDWVALWQSEIDAVAQDAELRQAVAALAGLGAGVMQAWLRAVQAWPAAPHHPVAPHEPPPGAAPTAAAPQPGGDAAHAGAGIDPAILARLAELERRLADLDGGAKGAGQDPGRDGGPARRRRRPKRGA